MDAEKSSLTRVPEFRAVGVSCGLKESGGPDLALILANHVCDATAVFTTNVFKAAPILYDMALLERTKGRLQGVVINAGNANAITGRLGLRHAERMASITESACRLPSDSIFVMSTGVIGKHLPMERIERGIRMASNAIRTGAGLQGQNTAQAILTTDLVSKEAFRQIAIGEKRVSIGGIAKGSGMIHPNMGTMLSVIVSDCVIEPGLLDTALRKAVESSFNHVTVDGDTSTNDTVLLMASGQARHDPILSANSSEYARFSTALGEVCTTLAKSIARDGEGATKLVEVIVRGAVSERQAETAAKTVATSPLVKTAIFGNDPNWGRILAAVGRSGASLDPTRVSLRIGGFELVHNGQARRFDGRAVQECLQASKEITLEVSLGVGQAEVKIWTCDLSYKYVEINAEYHT